MLIGRGLPKTSKGGNAIAFGYGPRLWSSRLRRGRPLRLSGSTKGRCWCIAARGRNVCLSADTAPFMPPCRVRGETYVPWRPLYGGGFRDRFQIWLSGGCRLVVVIGPDHQEMAERPVRRARQGRTVFPLCVFPEEEARADVLCGVQVAVIQLPGRELA